MSEGVILEKCMDFKNSCLTDTEKKQVMDMLYKYKESFSLRDEIGMCPNINVEIDVSDESPFSLDYIVSRKKIKNYKDMRTLCYLGIIKGGFSAYSSPMMLISRKVIKDKRVVTDFRHLNVSIAKNILAYPL